MQKNLWTSFLKEMEIMDSTNSEGTTSENWRRYDAELKFYEQIKEDILQEAEKAGISPRQELKLELGIEEIAVNIITYAYESPGYIWIRTYSDGVNFRIEFVDHGKLFDPLAQTMKHGDIPTDDQDEGGYGIFLVKKNFPSIIYRQEKLFGKTANHLIMELPLS